MTAGKHHNNPDDLLVRSPRQLTILGLVSSRKRPISSTELAAMTSETLGATAHHVRCLVARGLLEWGGERRVRGALQTFYRLSAAGEEARRYSYAAVLAELFGVAYDEDGEPLRPDFDALVVDELFHGLERMRPRYVQVMRRAVKRQEP